MEGLYRGDLFTHAVQYNAYCHISENYLRLIEVIDASCIEEPLLKIPRFSEEYTLPPVVCSEEDIQRMKENIGEAQCAGKKIIAINHGYNERLPIRSWPMDRLITLTNTLTMRTDVHVVVVGKKILPEDVRKQFPECTHLGGQLSVHELVTLFHVASVLVTQDCGMIHLAALSPVHIIGLYGPETPLLYGPLSAHADVVYKKYYCSPCVSAYNHRNSICVNNRCMQAITVEEIEQRVLTNLK